MISEVGIPESSMVYVAYGFPAASAVTDPNHGLDVSNSIRAISYAANQQNISVVISGVGLDELNALLPRYRRYATEDRNQVSSVRQKCRVH